MVRRAALALLLLGAAALAPAQKKPAVSPTFEVSGVVADPSGPLANKIIRVGPLDAQGNMLSIRNLSSGVGLNPQGTSDAQGHFHVTVARSLLRGYRDDAVGLRVSTDLGNNRISTSHESAVVKIDPKQDRIDVGRVVLQPLKAR